VKRAELLRLKRIYDKANLRILGYACLLKKKKVWVLEFTFGKFVSVLPQEPWSVGTRIQS
jgi:hypothetical protein